MKLLLDTHLLLWAGLGQLAQGSKGALSREATKLIQDANNTLFFSPASVWEVGIKNALGRDDFKVDPQVFRRGLLDNGYLELAISSAHAAAVANLPDIHRDPFDRMLVAQATVEGIVLLTNDSIIAKYKSHPVRLV